MKRTRITRTDVLNAWLMRGRDGIVEAIEKGATRHTCIAALKVLKKENLSKAVALQRCLSDLGYPVKNPGIAKPEPGDTRQYRAIELGRGTYVKVPVSSIGVTKKGQYCTVQFLDECTIIWKPGAEPEDVHVPEHRRRGKA